MKKQKLKKLGAVTKPVWPLQSQATSFYGDPRRPEWLHENTTDVPVPWQLLYEGKPIISHILIHKKCAASLTRVLASIWDGVHQDPHEISRRHYDHFSGSYNFRVMRGGLALSMHSYACAIDFYDEANQFHSALHFFQPDNLMVVAFEAEGWVWGGRWKRESVDAMHFQAARVG